MKSKINFYKNDIKLNSSFKYIKGKKDIKRILNYLSKEKKEKLSMSIFICDSKKMKELNKEHREKNVSTDVLSFPHNEYEDKFLYIGDVFINEEILESQSKEINSNPLIEFKFLAMHGILHLIGYDHIEKNDEEKMTKKQREIFVNLKIREW